MPLMTILFGVALMVIGIVAYIVSDPSQLGMLLTALFGLLALALGVGSVVKKAMRKHLIHGAVIIAGFGFIMPVIGLNQYLLEMEHNEQVHVGQVVLTACVCAGYFYLALQSFRNARRNRKENPDQEADQTHPAEPTEPAPVEAAPEPTKPDPPASA